MSGGGPEIPGVRYVEAHSSRIRQRPQAQPRGPYDLIVIHITDGAGILANTVSEWQTPGVTCAHLLVGQDGDAVQTMSLRFAAEHAHDLNAHSVGIEHECRSPGELPAPYHEALAPSDAMYQKSASITAYLLKAAGLPPTRDYVKGHKEADPKTNHDDCPLGCGWDWDHYMALVRLAYSQIGEIGPLVA